MALTYDELESITNDYFMADGKKASDVYFETSFLLNWLMNQKKGIWKRPEGGKKIRVPIEYDEQVTGWYDKGDPISSDDRESLNAAYFEWKHLYGNATVYRIDGLENSGKYAEVELVTQRVANAQKSVTKTLATSLYDAVGGANTRLTGLRACMNETATLAYGGIAENDLVSADGSKEWEGKANTTGGGITVALIREAATESKVRDGMYGKVNLVTTTEVLYNSLIDQLSVQQRYVNSDATAKAGFSGVHVEGKDIFPDDFCPSGFFFALNSKHIGFAIHKEGYFVRSPWKKIPDSAEDKSMKIYWDGNLVCDNRKAHISYASLTA